MQGKKLPEAVPKIIIVILLLFLIVAPISAYPWCGILNLYFQDVPIGIGNFHQLANYASGSQVSDENVTIDQTMGIVPIDAYMSDAGVLDNVVLQAGLRQYNIYGYASSVSSPSYFIINVSAYNTVTGKERFFYNISSVAISSVTQKLDTTYYVSPTSITFQSPERLLIRIGAYTTRNTATTIHFLNQGNTPTYVQSGYFNCQNATGGNTYWASSNTMTPLPFYIVVISLVIAILLIAHKIRKQ